MAYKLKLTQAQVDELIKLHNQCGWSVRQLEARFGIPKTTVHRIIQKGTGYEIIDTDSGK